MRILFPSPKWLAVLAMMALLIGVLSVRHRSVAQRERTATIASDVAAIAFSHPSNHTSEISNLLPKPVVRQERRSLTLPSSLGEETSSCTDALEGDRPLIETKAWQGINRPSEGNDSMDSGLAGDHEPKSIGVGVDHSRGVSHGQSRNRTRAETRRRRTANDGDHHAWVLACQL